MQIFRKLKALLSRSPSPTALPVTVSGSGFSVGSLHVAWSEIAEICAYKLDRLTVDEAILEFSLSNGERIPISEEQPGFAALETAVSESFPAVATWRQQVLQPPFARNQTVLYRRA